MTPVRRADPGDRAAVANVLDGAALAHEDLAARLRDGDAFVFETGGPVVGALVLVAPRATGIVEEATPTTGVGLQPGSPAPRRIAAVAVRRRRRGQGIGTALVEAAASDVGSLVAAFEDDLRPFYEQLGFAVEPLEDGRCQGRLPDPRDEPG